MKTKNLVFVGIADKIFILEDGKITLSGNKNLLKDKRIEHIYLGGR